jgi:PPK2 family polyphosphate:nucleotide phosphotransferase
MTRHPEAIELCRVPADGSFRLADHPTDWVGTADLPKARKDMARERSEQVLEENRAALVIAQEKLWANDTYAVLAVFQAMDAAGKDGTIKHVMSGVNPQGVDVTSFKVPSAEELDHHYLWRYAKAAPERGRIGIFNRSYYEEVLVVRVHPEVLDRQRLPGSARVDGLWDQRFEDINAFERHLDRNGIKVVKFFLHVGRDEQRERFLERIDDPSKNWKFNAADVRERRFWDDYQRFYDEAIRATAAKASPWFVVPADNKWFTRLVVAGAVVETLEKMDLAYPKVDAKQAAELAKSRELLLAEKR